ncbi:conserved hypothetical protein [Magpiepox virus]|nr:conserved hypothetical protein [Magpiepox virus]
MLLVVKIRDRLRFIRKLFRYVGDKLYAKAALTLVNRLVTPRIPVVKDLIPFYYAKKNFWKFALLYGLKKISDKAPKEISSLHGFTSLRESFIRTFLRLIVIPSSTQPDVSVIISHHLY